MSFNIEQSFSYIKKDRDWLKKLAGFSLFMSATVYLVFITLTYAIFGLFKNGDLMSGILFVILFYILWMFVISIPSAYCALNANRRIYKPDAPLYEWTKNVKSIINTSLVLLLSYIILFLAAVIPLFLIIYALITNAGITYKGIIVLVFFLIAIVFPFMSKILYLSYTVDLKPSSFFNFQRIKKMLSGDNLGNYFLYIGICIVIQLMLSVVNSITGIGVIFTFPYSIYVFSDLDAQFIRQAFEIDINKNEITN